MKEYDMYIPLYHHDNSPVEAAKFQALQGRLLEHFDGLAFFPQPNEGFWRVGDVAYRDEIVVYRVVARTSRSARRFFKQLKEELQAVFRREEILIVERDAGVL